MTPLPRDDSWEEDRFENDDDFDVDEDIEATTSVCPYCGEEVYDDAEWCPSCDQYLSQEDAPRSRMPRWLAVGIVACLAVIVLWIFLV